jgi:phosphate transport system substrate-binding protein
MDSSSVAKSGAPPSESDALAAIAHKAEVSTNASGAAIALMDAASGVLICRARSGSHAPDIGTSLQREGTFAGLCVQTGQTMCCDDTEKETRLDSQAARILGIRSMLVTPITQGGNVIGALAVFSYTRRAFTLAHREVLRALANETAAFVARQGSRNDSVVLERLVEPAGEAPRPLTNTAKAGGEATVATDQQKPAPLPPKRSDIAPPRQTVRPQRKGVGLSPILVGALTAAAIVGGGWGLWRSGWLTPAAATATPAIRLHGSNTLGSEYIPALAKAYLEHIGATAIRVQPTKKEEVLIGGVTPKGSALELDIQSHGSWTGFKDLAADKADIAMASTRLPDPESLKGDSPDATEKRLALAKLKGLKSAETEFVVGLDGLAIISTTSRPAPSLSKQQVCDVFSGKIANWSEIDPRLVAAPISVYVRDKNSGTRKTFVDMCFEGKDNLPATGPTVFEDSQQLSNSVAKDPNAIGFVGLPFVHPANSVAVDGRLPDESSVRLEEYAFTRRLYLYRHPHQPGEAELTGEFIEFALSAEGQRVVQQAGFVDQEVRLESPDAPRGAPRDYQALTAGAKRASLALRFEPNSSRLEGKALRDIVRLKRVLEDNHALNDRILVLGFSDTIGNPVGNCAISKERAQVAEAQLHKIGLPNTTVAAFGQQLPLTTERGAEAMAKNRRVEIWVAPTVPDYTGPTTCR